MPNNNKNRGRTVILPMRGNQTSKKWIEWLDKNCQASAGPYPNIAGMREKYWGKAALIVKAGIYIYLIANNDDGRRLPWE